MIESVEKIKLWRQCFSLPVNTSFTIPSTSDLEAHISHIIEESNELLTAFKKDDKFGIYDGAGDTFWVTTSLNLLIGIPVHQHFYHKNFYAWGKDFDDLDTHMIEGYINIIQTNALKVSELFKEGNTESLTSNLLIESTLWSLTMYTVALIDYLGVDINKLISLIYDSNMSKLCDIDVANKSKKMLEDKLNTKILIQLSPEWKNLPRIIGDKPKKYYLCEESGRVRKPLGFKEPRLDLY